MSAPGLSSCGVQVRPQTGEGVRSGCCPPTRVTIPVTRVRRRRTAVEGVIQRMAVFFGGPRWLVSAGCVRQPSAAPRSSRVRKQTTLPVARHGSVAHIGQRAVRLGGGPIGDGLRAHVTRPAPCRPVPGPTPPPRQGARLLAASSNPTAGPPSRPHGSGSDTGTIRCACCGTGSKAKHPAVMRCGHSSVPLRQCVRHGASSGAVAPHGRGRSPRHGTDGSAAVIVFRRP